MIKYLAIARITFANLLQYRWDFLISQSRIILLLITLYFLWTQVFKAKATLFNFSQAQIITYVFLASIVRQFVLISATDQIAQELQSGGKFFSYLLRPVGYFRFWFTVDLVYKITSLIFIILITSVMLNILNITLTWPTEVFSTLLFLVSIFIASLIYFYIGILVSTTGFWTSQVWGLQFLVVLILEFCAGSYFPIDVLPANLQSIIKLTPFPYLLYYPISIFLGELSLVESIKVITIAVLWLAAIFIITKFIWNKGLKVYEAWGG